MLNTLRTRRFSSRAVEQTQSIVVFQLGQQCFGLPIAAVRRVIPLEQVYRDAQQQGLSLARHLNQDVVVLDVKLCLFGQSAMSAGRAGAAQGGEYLLLLDASAEEQMGLPIESAPQILRLPESALSPLPETYRRLGNIRCLSNRMATVEGRAPILLLEAETLAQTYLNWLAANPPAMTEASAAEFMDLETTNSAELDEFSVWSAPIEAAVEESLAALMETAPAATELMAEFAPETVAEDVTEEANVAEAEAEEVMVSVMTSAEGLTNPVEPDLADLDLFMASLPDQIM